MMPDDSPITIMIVDDQQLVRMGFRMVLEVEPGLTVIAEASDGATAIAAAQRHRPQVVLMDVRMPGIDGIAATREIVKNDPECRVIVLTTFDLDEYAFGGLRAGASGFLLKDAKPAELVAAIHGVVAGDAVVPGRITKAMLDLYASRLPDLSSTNPVSALTPREHEVLLAITDGLNNAEIATALTLTESTVKTHVGRVLMKLGVRDRVQAVILAYERGLR